MNFIEFLIAAKISGYATGGEGNELKFDDGSKGFEYVLDHYRYLDRYIGFNPFAGTEFIYDLNSTPIWSMNYYGAVSRGYQEPSRVYEILKLAMQQISPEFPFRGPASFIKSGLVYENDQHGNIDNFFGKETIYEDGAAIYSLSYHGGSLEQYR